MTEILKKKRKAIFVNLLSPGDILMLTAAVRDLHRAHPGEFMTDVYTSVADLWEQNPYITKLPFRAERLGDQREANSIYERILPHRDLKITVDDPEIEVYDVGYDGHYQASIHRSNQNAYHFIHGYAQDIEQKLGVRVPITEFKGDIHLSDQERSWMSQVQELGITDNFWLVFAGGKYDYTAKWWSPVYYQKVVDHFKGRILFVQCGDPQHFHPSLNGVVNLIGNTSARQLIRLVYHSNGVLCPVTFAMHLAAAVPMRPFDLHGRKLPANRPCVVLAGGREAMHWEAYPNHQFMHTVGALPCCARGGCWKSRCQKVGDNDPKDDPAQLCVNPVKVSETLQIGKCQTMITPQMVCSRISTFFSGGLFAYNNSSELPETGLEAEKRESLNLAKYLVERFRPRTMLDIGCKRQEFLKNILYSGVDVYGVRGETQIVISDEEFPTARISIADLSKHYWKAPIKFDLISTATTSAYTGRSAQYFADTVISNLKRGGVLVIAPSSVDPSFVDAREDDWLKRLSQSGLKYLSEETDRIRRLTHRVGYQGKELVFVKE
jgi:ADP-heptose:LPS heptosyltransferase